MAARKKTDLAAVANDVRDRGLLYPDTYVESPWGEQVLKVNNKMFLAWHTTADLLTLTFRLPHSGQHALQLPFAEPTGYGLGKSGWVTLRIPPGEDVVKSALYAWVDESYRSVAPKTTVRQLPETGPPAPSRTPPAPLPKVTARVALVCEDPLRAERAQKTWRQEGIELAKTLSVHDHALPKSIDAVVVDLGRQWKAAFELAGRLSGTKLMLVGVRDARMEQDVSSMNVKTSRLPPGDPKVAALLREWLS